jgi:chromosome segregation ATPase
MQGNGCRRAILTARANKFLVLAAVVWGVIQGSTAIAQQPVRNEPAPAQASPNDEIDQLRKSVRQLTAEVAKLRTENARLEKYRQIDYLRDLLVKEEQRVETLQKELLDIGNREVALQKRLDEIEPQLRPDRIQQSLAGVGSMRPEQERESLETQLANEKRRIQTQLDQLRQNRTRLHAAISTAEASIGTIRQRLKEAVRAAGLPNAN